MDFELFSLMVSGLVNDFPVRYRTQEGLPVGVVYFIPTFFAFVVYKALWSSVRKPENRRLVLINLNLVPFL